MSSSSCIQCGSSRTGVQVLAETLSAPSSEACSQVKPEPLRAPAQFTAESAQQNPHIWWATSSPLGGLQWCFSQEKFKKGDLPDTTVSSCWIPHSLSKNWWYCSSKGTKPSKARHLHPEQLGWSILVRAAAKLLLIKITVSDKTQKNFTWEGKLKE